MMTQDSYESLELRLHQAKQDRARERRRPQPRPTRIEKWQAWHDRVDAAEREVKQAQAALERLYPDFAERRIAARQARQDAQTESLRRQSEAEDRMFERARTGADAKPEMARLRRRLQAGLRRLGFALERSAGGSNYYTRRDERGVRQTVRLSDHDVPMTQQRSDASDRGGFTWARDGEQFIISPESNETEVDAWLRGIGA